MSKNKRLDALGDRLKTFERIETEARFPPNNYLYVRIDGRSFSKFTKGLTRPYDTRLSSLMQLVTASLVKEFNAVIGYTQSDEISLIINNTYEKSCIFEAKKQKLISTIASHTAAVFNANLASVIPEKDPLKTGRYPSFDCRIFPVTTASEATNAILWREHGVFEQRLAAHKCGQTCPSCVSYSSKEENKWLDSLNIPTMLKQYSLFKNHIVDGYDPKTNTVYQYHGVYWHGHPDFFDQNEKHPHFKKKTFGEIYQRTLDRDESIRQAGYNLVIKWSHE